MIDYLRPGDSAAVIAKLADPAIRIVSLTITEGGYYIDPASAEVRSDPSRHRLRRRPFRRAQDRFRPDPCRPGRAAATPARSPSPS